MCQTVDGVAEALAGGFVTSLPRSHGVTGAHGVSHHGTFDRPVDRLIEVLRSIQLGVPRQDQHRA